MATVVVVLNRLISRRIPSSFSTKPAYALGALQTTTPVTSPVHSMKSRDLSTSASLKASSAGKHWFAERAASIALLAAVPAGLMYPNPLFDYTIALVLPLHIHWGINSVIVDYVPRPLVMVSKLVLAVLSLSALGGLVYLTYNDVGVCNAIRMIWAL